MTKRNEEDRIKARLAFHNRYAEAATDPGERRRSEKAAQFLTNGDYEVTGQVHDQAVIQHSDLINRGESAKESQLKAASSPKRPRGIVEVIRLILTNKPRLQNAASKMAWEELNKEQSESQFELDDGHYEVFIEDSRAYQIFTKPNRKPVTRSISEKTFINYVNDTKKKLKK